MSYGYEWAKNPAKDNWKALAKELIDEAFIDQHDAARMTLPRSVWERASRREIELEAWDDTWQRVMGVALGLLDDAVGKADLPEHFHGYDRRSWIQQVDDLKATMKRLVGEFDAY